MVIGAMVVGVAFGGPKPALARLDLNELAQALGQPPPYDLSFTQEEGAEKGAVEGR